MAQLRSFKYIEPEAALSEVSDDVEEEKTKNEVDDRQRQQQQQQQQRSATIDSASSASIVTIAGGNLTTASSTTTTASGSSSSSPPESGAANNNGTTPSGRKSSGSSALDGEASTLSSHEEYQLARHDLVTDDDDEGANNFDVTGSVTRINIEASPATKPPTVDRATKAATTSDNDDANKSVVPAQAAPGVAEAGSLPGLRTPLTPRLQPSSKQGSLYMSRQQAAGSPQLAGMPARLGRRSASGDSLITTNHFEIRWRDINLVSRQDSKVPRFIEDNPLYRLLFKRRVDAIDDADAADDGAEKGLRPVEPVRFYHSPPIRLKSASGFLPPTISEEDPVSVLEAGGGKGEPQQQQQQREQQQQQQQRQKQPPPSSLAHPLAGALGKGVEGSAAADSSSSSASATQDPQVTYRTILDNVSGSVFSGQLTAILGPSGVGKTTLLNSLTGRNTLEGTGRVALLGGASKRMSVVTVPQADILPGKLTTIEDLRFTSRLKNPQRDFNHRRNIERVVRHLHMEKFLNTRIDKLSGGEARRLSIGRELLNSPDVMILDEPTSGLDANTCKKIITALRDIVVHSDNILDRPMAIIITIHQPQQEVLNLFHRTYIMALGGRVIYEGPPSCLLPGLLEHSSLSRVCAVDQLNENPAIVALEVASGEYGMAVVAELALHHESQVYEESLLGAADSPYSTPRGLRSPRKSPLSVSSLLQRRAREAGRQSPLVGAGGGGGGGGRQTPLIGRRGLPASQLDRMSSVTSVSYASTYDADLPEPTSKLKVDKRLRRSVVMKSDFWSHTLTLMSRCWLLTTRDMFLMGIRIIGFLLVAGGIVQIFHHALDANENQCPTYETEVDDIVGYIGTTKDRLLGLQSTLKQAGATHLFFFHLVLCLTMVTSALTGLVFPLQMRMFVREYKNGWYSPASFITSQTLAEIPVDLIGPILTTLIVYPLCNQPASPYFWREIGYILVLCISSIICKSQAQVVGAILMDSVENSVFASCVMVTVPALTSGIAVRISQMSLPLQWVSWLSFLRYTFESLFVIRYGYGLCPCDPELVNGYPIRMSAGSVPPQLDRLARGLLDLGGQGSDFGPAPANNATGAANETALALATTADDAITNGDDGGGQGGNLFVNFIRLVTDASNQFVRKPHELGDCSKYRSLYLMDMSIDDNILFKWGSILVLIFIISRFLTYFVIKTVIKMRRQ